MKRLFGALLSIILASFCLEAAAQEEEHKYRFDGGMMLHTGYLCGEVMPGLNASGAPFGVGGLLRYHFGKHWRVGAEGYVSTLKLLGNGSYVKYGWGGVVGDFHLTFGKFLPYVGLTVGGGSNTAYLMMDSPTAEWDPVETTYYRQKAFFLIDPFIGTDFALTKAIHLTLKIDYLVPFGQNLYMATGPRFSFGVLFYH